MKDREKKIRKLLGTKFHLFTHYRADLEEPVEWALYRKYDDTKIFFSELNEAIMTSEKNTFDELYEFAKKHHEIDEHMFMSSLNVIIAWFTAIIVIINMIFFQNETLRGFLIGIDFMIIIYGMISHTIWNKNWYVRMNEIKGYHDMFVKKIGGEKNDNNN